MLRGSKTHIEEDILEVLKDDKFEEEEAEMRHG